ncbi:hypothetical protein A33Q_4239 [Indibacter alkaliphilus LW1]|uniref:DUF4221 domain-containing protein n=1 Tax=Indibacter alkaliphilus (strain CCUG 57479 / KCTC 22604 / LW1) TaxID=1189612 RepID=S2DJJ5_INDAL|nr:DUF4221 family protein [Indibacter alkaliphilus]EOZ92146.1 hypothetical protein A33Q_4239 [Indibacter alkaliphilus LW1]
MKNYAIALFSSLIFACGGGNETETGTDFSNITFTMDTVVVDPGEEIMNLKNGLWSSVMTDDKEVLYLWNMDESTMDKVSINDLRLVEKIKFEKEGPDGVGSYVTWMTILDNERILIANFQGMGLFDMKGKKLKTYKLDKENFEGDTLMEGESFNRKSLISQDGNIIYGLMGNWMNEKQSFSKVNFEEMVVKKFDLPGIESLKDYSVMLKSDQMIMVSTSDKSLQRVGNKIILSNSAYAALFIFDTEKDSIYQVDYEPKLTAKAKKGDYPKEVDSEKRFKEVMADIRAEINFREPIWDPSSKRYYRFSYETNPGEISNKPPFDEEEEKPISKVYFTVLDENFNILGESLIPQLQEPPSYPFVKEGKIWYYVNVDDELGFVRMELNY